MATSAPQHTSRLETSRPRRVARIPERTVLTLGAAAAGIGLVLQIVMDQFHPHHEQPNNSVGAFSEYAHSNTWTAIHIGQFFGMLLIAFAMLVLCRSLRRETGLPGVLATGAGVAVVVLASVFAVQMAVDGVALKHAVNTWVDAGGAAKTSALQVAEGLRWLEKGLSGFFHLMNATALLGLGLAIVAGRSYRSWPGWVAIAASIAFFLGGVSTATTGFSSQASTILQPALLLLLVFLVGAYASVWRADARSVQHAS